MPKLTMNTRGGDRTRTRLPEGDFKSNPPRWGTTTYTTARRRVRQGAATGGRERRDGTGDLATTLATTILTIATHCGRARA